MARPSSSSKRRAGDRARARSAWLAGALACTVLCSSVPGCAATGEREQPPYVRAIEARNRHLEAQFGAGNMLGVADVYTDDGVMVDARGQRTRGREEIDAYWSAIESPVEWRLEVRSIRGSDAVAYELGTSRLSTRRDGEVHTSVSQFLLVWRHEPDGEWRIELDAFWPAP